MSKSAGPLSSGCWSCSKADSSEGRWSLRPSHCSMSSSWWVLDCRISLPGLMVTHKQRAGPGARSRLPEPICSGRTSWGGPPADDHDVQDWQRVDREASITVNVRNLANPFLASHEPRASVGAACDLIGNARLREMTTSHCGPPACVHPVPQPEAPRIRPLVGTPVPAVTRTCSTSATWLHEVPRIWRTASAIPFIPWM